MFFAHLDQVAEGDSTPGRRLLRRDGFHAFFQFDPKLPLELADERVARADGAGLELRDDADPLVDLRAEIRLLPSPCLASLADPLRKVVREFEFAGLRIHVPRGHASLAHLQALRDDGRHRALPQCRRRDLVPEPRTVRANRQNGRVDGHIFQARHVRTTQFADHESSPQRLNKKCLVYSLRHPAHPPDDSMDDDQIREFSEKMSERIASLEDKNAKLLETARRVEDPLLKPDLYRKVGIEPPKGVLLVGPPGTGKTLLAKAVANRTQATFIRFVGSELVQKYIGEGARLVRELFQLAREKSPSIVFIDELDSVGAKRLEIATSGDREVQRTLMQLLAELDGFNPLGEVKIIGATNRPDILDEALLRPGRFDRIIEIPIPNQEARMTIFKIHTRKMSVAPDVDYGVLAARCEGTTGADIHAMCTEAGMFAIREEREVVTMADFERAVDKVLGDNPVRSGDSSGAMYA